MVWQQNPQVFNPVFWKAQSRKKDLKYRAGQPCCLLSNPDSPALHNMLAGSCSKIWYVAGSTIRLPSSQILWKEKMRQSGIFDAILDLLKTLHKALVAQIQKKIKQYEIGSLSLFWEFFSQHFASRVCWFCTSTSASASFQTGSMLCVLFTPGSFSHISNSPTYSLDRNIATDTRRKRYIW